MPETRSLSLRERIGLLALQWRQDAVFMTHNPERRAAFIEAAVKVEDICVAHDFQERERVLADAERSTPAEPPPDTYTPILWATMTDDERYEEYIRVRKLLAPGPTPAEPQKVTVEDRIRHVYLQRQDDDSKEACDECDGCGPAVMCSYHSLLSEVAWALGQPERARPQKWQAPPTPTRPGDPE